MSSLSISVFFKGAQSYLFSFFFQTFEILVSQGSSYFSHNRVKFYSWNVFHVEDNENVPGYGIHN